MTRFVTIAITLAGALSFVSGEAVAAPSGFYSATPIAAPSPGKSIVRGLMWTCDGTSCAAPKDTSRAAIVCAATARELGGLGAFRAGAEQFDEAALAKCNAKSKGAGVAVARAD